MILITGNDPIVDGLCSPLDALGSPYRRVDKVDADQAWGAAYDVADARRAATTHGRAASASERGLREIISAAKE